MKKTKVVIVCPWWRRWEVTALHVKNIRKFMDNVPEWIEMKYVAIVSPEDPELRDLLEIAFDNNLTVCKFRNLPVSNKLNAGIWFALDKFNPDYIMNMGSDDLVCSSIWDEYKPFIERKSRFFGVDSVYIIDFYTHESVYLDLYNDKFPVGVLRMISVWAIKFLKETFSLNPYPEGVNSGMDTASLNRLKRAGVIADVIHTDGRVFTAGLKCNVSINHFMHLSNIENKSKKVSFRKVKHLL